MSLIQAVEARMRQSETFTCTVPGLAVTAQAILLSVALSPTTSEREKVFAGFVALLTLLPSMQFLGKHTFNFDMFEAVAEREREKIGLPRITRSVMLDEEGLAAVPLNTLLRQREWLVKHPSGRGWRRFRNHAVVRWKAVVVWSVALGALGVLDVIVVVVAAVRLFS